jgi:hypothetical protein
LNLSNNHFSDDLPKVLTQYPKLKVLDISYNLKGTNVLLDTPDMNAHIADYCLHRLMPQASTIKHILDSGVLGNHAPKLVASKNPMPSFKSDVCLCF